MLLGDPDNPAKPDRLLGPVRTQPFQVILFDELEKAHPNVWDVFLQLLDDGRLSSVRGGVVNFHNTLIIATTNVGASEASKATPGFVPQNNHDGHSRFRKTLEQHFRLEFLDRFQHIVYFHPLSHVQAIAIAQIAHRVDETGLSRELDRLSEIRRAPEFWKDLDSAAQVMQELENLKFTLQRLDRLREQLDEQLQHARSAATHSAWQAAAAKQLDLEQQVTCATRELCQLTVFDKRDFGMTRDKPQCGWRCGP